MHVTSVYSSVWSQAQKVKIYSAAHSIPHLLNHSSDTHLAVVDKCGLIAKQIHLQVISRISHKEMMLKGSNMLQEAIEQPSQEPSTNPVHMGSEVPQVIQITLAPMAIDQRSPPRKLSGQNDGGNLQNPSQNAGGTPQLLECQAEVTVERIQQVTTTMVPTTGSERSGHRTGYRSEDGSKLDPPENSRANSAAGPVATVRGETLSLMQGQTRSSPSGGFLTNKIVQNSLEQMA